MVNKKTASPYWRGMAARFEALAPPLRVSASEREIYIKLVSQWHADSPAPRVLVMGATPDFYYMPWPEGTDLLAVDLSAGMLSDVWPGNETQSLCQDWCSMNLPDASRDLALCDGGLSFFRYPDDLQSLANNLGRIITPGGLFIVRLYLDADYRESPAEIFQELLQGRIQNSSELKLRLWLALNPPGGAGVRLHDVWDSFNSAFSPPNMPLSSIPWPDGEWQSMRAYEGMQDMYYFPSVEEVTEIMANSNSPFSREADITPAGPCHQHLRILSFRRCG